MGADGAPGAPPMRVAIESDRVLVITSLGRTKGRNLRHDPRPMPSTGSRSTAGPSSS
ncbi:hypothetical protein [Kitasatospora sp. NBC_01560]|uniref:hypothetical protein n=1 Tax=Kitasatospora sp. NBC_01560 TaxID=2975965 RepID=UPI003866D60D